MNSGFECNIEDTFNKFMNLTRKEMQGTVRKALVMGAKELQKQTKTNLTQSVVNRNNPHWYKGNLVTYSDKMEDAVRLGRYDKGGYVGDQSIKVHIMGTRNTGSGTYRARFIEKGTKERYAKTARNRNHELIRLKKPKRLGRISGRWFFKNAQQQVIPSLPGLYMREIDKTINKLNNTQI